MKHRNSIILFFVCLILIWGQTWFQWPHDLLGVRLDFLPVLVLYCALFCTWKELFITCVVGGIFYDSASLNPLGITTLSTLLVGYLLYCHRNTFLYTTTLVQMLLGFAMGIIIPFISLLQLTGLPIAPKMDLTLTWVFIVLGGTSAMAAPIVIRAMDYITKEFWLPRTHRYYTTRKYQTGQKG